MSTGLSDLMMPENFLTFDSCIAFISLVKPARVYPFNPYPQPITSRGSMRALVADGSVDLLPGKRKPGTLQMRYRAESEKPFFFLPIIGNKALRRNVAALFV